MLLNGNGALRLCKAFQNPSTATVTEFKGISSLATNASRSKMAWLGKGQCLSSVARSFKAPNPHRLWHPAQGIVFGVSGANPSRSMNTSVAADIRSDPIPPSKPDNGFTSAELEPASAAGVGAVAINDRPETNPPTLDLIEESLPVDPEQEEIPLSTIPFKMSEEIFRGAKNAVPGSPESFWSHALYRGPEVDGVEPKVKIHYCRSKHTTQRVLEQYFMDKKVLGFDIEWKPDSHRNSGLKKNVSLIQLASEDRIALFHIALYSGDKVEDLVAPLLKTIMEDPSVSKLGVAIKADCTRLRKFLGINTRGIFELSHLYKLVKFSSSKDYKLINKRLVSLATQVQEHLHLPLFKGEVRGSDWSQELAMDQIIYAASDSYAGIHLFDTLEIKRKALDPTPPRPYHAEEDKPIRIAEGVEIPTDEELAPDEPESSTTPKRKYTKRSSSYLASAAETIELDPEFTIQSPSLTSTSSKLSPPLKHPLVLAGESRVFAHRSSHPRSRASAAYLRCYFIWYHNPELSLKDIAAVLREVPLQTTTVINYIIESIKLDKLPFEQERLKEVLETLPEEVVRTRYMSLAKTCGIKLGRVANQSGLTQG